MPQSKPKIERCKKLVGKQVLCNRPIGQCIHNYKPTPFGKSVGKT